jgi:hypothetical protein
LVTYVHGRPFTAALSILLALTTAAACGSGHKSDSNSLPRASTGTVTTGKPAKRGFDINACLQRHGMTVLRPGRKPPKSESSAKRRAALTACVKEQKAATKH